MPESDAITPIAFYDKSEENAIILAPYLITSHWQFPLATEVVLRGGVSRTPDTGRVYMYSPWHYMNDVIFHKDNPPVTEKAGYDTYVIRPDGVREIVRRSGYFSLVETFVESGNDGHYEMYHHGWAVLTDDDLKKYVDSTWNPGKHGYVYPLALNTPRFSDPNVGTFNKG